jgi:uncharacterized membrane protein
MFERLSDAAAVVAYQAAVAVGILALPLAVLARRVGVYLPLHRLIERIKSTR